MFSLSTKFIKARFYWKSGAFLVVLLIYNECDNEDTNSSSMLIANMNNHSLVEYYIILGSKTLREIRKLDELKYTVNLIL